MKDIYLDAKCIGDAILFDVKPNYYDESNTRQENPTGYKYGVVLPHQGFDKLQVKISGKQLLEIPLSGYEPHVEFEALQVKPYVDRNGRLAFTATATGVKVVATGDGKAPTKG